MQEIWKPIAGYEGLYEVSSLGNVRSNDREITHRNGRRYRVKGRTLVFSKPHGYHQVTLCDGNSKKPHKVHRLVASAFIPRTPGKDVVNHLDGNKGNNSVSNLEWTCPKGNARHARDAGLVNTARGELSGGAKLSSDDIKAIRSMLRSGRRQSEIASEFGVTQSNISRISTNDVWAHL